MTTPTPAQVEACRMALFNNSNGARGCWTRMPEQDRVEHARKWLAALAYRAGRPPATKQEVDELFR